MITKTIEEVDMFASDAELEAQLTPQELMLIKLVKVEEFVDDLYGAILYPQTQDMFPPQDYYNKIRVLLKDLRKLNKNKI